jgi:predicted Zn-dependent protease
MLARCLVPVSATLLLAVTLCRAQQPSSAPTSFSFSPVDLELLDKSNQLDKQFQEKGLVYNDPETTKYIAKVGRAVLPAGPELQNVDWQFFVLRNPIPNAFSLPNGSIYVHTGLLAVLENEAQLAGVLAHEETHVINRHAYIENRSARKKMVADDVLFGAASAGLLAGGVGGAVSAMMRLAIPSIIGATIYGYSRELEQEADMRAVHAVADAGYSAEEMKNSLEALQQEHDVDLSKKSFYQDHPKLKDRSRYVGDLAASLQPHATNAMVETDRYLIETESAVRHDTGLEIRAGRARTAVWVMERVVKRDDKLADNFYALGEAYRGLGPRTPEPKPEELTEDGKKEARKMMSKMTPQEYEAALLKTPAGQQAWTSNQELAEKNYKRALALAPDSAAPHRGLGFLYDGGHQTERSMEEFRKYLELEPSAVDSPQIRRRVEAMEKKEDPNPPQLPPAK